MRKDTKKIKLNLGCGSKCLPGYVNVDKYYSLGVEVVDLDIYPWKWGDCSIDEIRCSHVLEHIKDPSSFIRECHRILKVGGAFHVYLPTYNHGCFHYRGIHGKGYFYPVTHKTVSNETNNLFQLIYERPKDFSIRNLIIRIRFMILNFFAREFEYLLIKEKKE